MGQPGHHRRMTSHRTSSVRRAALAALGAAVVAVLLFVLAIFTSPLGVAVGAAAWESVRSGMAVGVQAVEAE